MVRKGMGDVIYAAITTQRGGDRNRLTLFVRPSPPQDDDLADESEGEGESQPPRTGSLVPPPGSAEAMSTATSGVPAAAWGAPGQQQQQPVSAAGLPAASGTVRVHRHLATHHYQTAAEVCPPSGSMLPLLHIVR